MRKALPTRGSGPPSGATCWTVLITHAKTCAKAEGLDGRPSDNRGGADDHRPPINRERGGQEIGDTICERSQSAGGIFHRVGAVQQSYSEECLAKNIREPFRLNPNDRLHSMWVSMGYFPAPVNCRYRTQIPLDDRATSACLPQNFLGKASRYRFYRLALVMYL